MPKRNLFQLCRNSNCPNYPIATEKQYCGDCEQEHNRELNSREHYQGDYDKRARGCVSNALAQGLPCGICGNVMLVTQKLSAHHVRPGDRNSKLVATHLSCNISIGSNI